MPDLMPFLIVVLLLSAYIVRDVGINWEKAKAEAHETWRRIITVSAQAAFFSLILYLIVTEISGYTTLPFFGEPDVSILWFASVVLLITVLSKYFRGARVTSKVEQANKLKAADYMDQQLAGRLKPLEGAVVGVQAGVSELSKLVNLLDKELEHLDSYIQRFANDVTEQTKTVKDLAGDFALRERQYLKVASQYDEWYDTRMSANRELVALTTGAGTMLERVATLVDEIDELLGTLGVTGGRVSPPLGGLGICPCEAPASAEPPNPDTGGSFSIESISSSISSMTM